MGAHSFKLGGRFLRTSYFNRFMNFGSNFQGAGEYVFANLDDFETFTPSSYFRPIQEGGGVPTSDFSVIDWALYLQDSWQLSPRLTATFGLRYGQKSFRDSPTPVASVEQAFGWPTGFAPTDKNNFSPRLALAYDLHGDGRSVVRGGLGFFYGQLPGVVGGNVLQTERPVLEVFCNGSLADGDPDAPPPPTDYATWDRSGLGSGGVPEAPITCAGASAGGVPTFTFWAPDFEMPEVLKANLGYETMIGDRSRFAVNLLYSQTWNLYTVRNLNLRDSQFQLSGEGSRRVFSPMGVFDPTSANTTGSRRNLEFGEALVNFNDGRARAIVAEFRGSRRVSPGLSINASYTFTKAWDNSPYSCCTAFGGYAGPTTGAFGPNEIGSFGDSDHAWGISDFAREHAIVVSAFASMPFGVRFAAFWKSQSGRPWTVVGDDDLNGDGITGNDRTFIFAPADLPLASTGDDAVAERALYQQILNGNSCVGDFVGRIVERNTCRMPWRHDLNIRLTRGFGTVSGQRAELQVDFFNVLNGLGRLFCDDLTSGFCGLGRVTGVFGSDQELLDPRGFDPATGQILYQVNDDFGEEQLLGANLVLQFQLQVALRYFF